MFYLSKNDRMRLKSFSSSTKGSKGTIRIDLECDDLSELGYALSCLAEVEAGQRAAADAAKEAAKAERSKPRQKALALPAPRLALPAPKVR